jgi:prevent-host-death family protein
MRTLAISDFKAHALQVLSQVAETREGVIVTKRGKPLAEVIPFTPEASRPGTLANALVFEKDIVTPLGDEMWDVCK